MRNDLIIFLSLAKGLITLSLLDHYLSMCFSKQSMNRHKFIQFVAFSLVLFIPLQHRNNVFQLEKNSAHEGEEKACLQICCYKIENTQHRSLQADLLCLHAAALEKLSNA